MKKHRAFTLIELLLVTGIISVLMSVIFFRVTEAKKKAEDVHMVAETAQVSRAIYQYKEDNGGFVPRSLNSTGPQTINESTVPEYKEALQPLVTGGYLPSIPHSPSGSDYSYIISSDGQSAVFAANLNFARQGGAHNSCELVTTSTSNNFCQPFTTPPPTTSFAIIKVVPIQIFTNATCATPPLSNTFTQPIYVCIDNTTNNRNTYCSCSNGLATSNDLTNVPDEMCQSMFDSNCQATSFRAFSWKVSEYQTYLTYLTNLAIWQTASNQATVDYAACIANQQNVLCNGSSDSDYCSCL